MLAATKNSPRVNTAGLPEDGKWGGRPPTGDLTAFEGNARHLKRSGRPTYLLPVVVWFTASAATFVL